jgi:carbonyl reductase 1
MDILEVGEFIKFYDDRGTGSKGGDISFFRPALSHLNARQAQSVERGGPFFFFGDMVSPSRDFVPANASYVVARQKSTSSSDSSKEDDQNSPFFAAPVSFERVWRDKGTSGKYGDLCAWRAVPPQGYVDLGLLVSDVHDCEPVAPYFRCVREDLVREARVQFEKGGKPLWTSFKSKARDGPASVWRLGSLGDDGALGNIGYQPFVLSLSYDDEPSAKSGDDAKPFFPPRLCYLPLPDVAADGGGAASSSNENEAPAQFVAEDGVRVLTLNIKILQKGSSPFNEYKQERLEYFFQRIMHDYDVIALQEIFEPHGSELVRLAARKGFHHHVQGVVAQGMLRKTIGDGLLILSKFPLVHTQSKVYNDRVTLPSVLEWQVREPAYLYACVRLAKPAPSSSSSPPSSSKKKKKKVSDKSDPAGGSYLHVVCTHLQSGPGGGSAERERAKELAEVRDFVAKLRTREPHHPLILCGDINLNGRKSKLDEDTDSDEYLGMMRLFADVEPHPGRDILKEHTGIHPITCGDVRIDADGSEHALDTSMTGMADWKTRKRLDFIVFFEGDSNGGDANERMCPVVSSVAVQPFFVAVNNRRGYTQMSDHYGVDVVCTTRAHLDRLEARYAQQSVGSSSSPPPSSAASSMAASSSSPTLSSHAPAPTVAVVSGSNQGIGLEIVRKLATDNPNDMIVYLTSRDLARGELALQQLKLANVRLCQLDITDQQSVDRLAAHLDAAHPNGIDVLVNNAGIAAKGSVFDAEVARWTIDTNLYGTMRLTDALMPLLQRGRRPARIVMVSSRVGLLSKLTSDELRARFVDPKLDVGGLTELVTEFIESIDDGSYEQKGFPKTTYGVSKVALSTYTRILARQLPSDALLIAAGCPGWCRSNMAGDKAPRSAAQGAEVFVRLASAPLDASAHGNFYVDDFQHIDY